MKKIYLLVLMTITFSLNLHAEIDMRQFRDKADFMTWDTYGTSYDTLYFMRLSEKEVALLSIGTMRDTFEIPSTITDLNEHTYQVTSIADSAFLVTGYLRDQLKQIILPETVKEIGDHAFDDCYGLTSFTMPNNVLSIGENAFCGCWKIEELILSTNLEVIGDYAFQSCTNLLSITIPSRVTNIGASILFNCTNLQSIMIDPENSKYDCRNNCNAIIETETNTLIAGCYRSTIPNTILKIGDNAFRNHQNLTSIDIPDNVTDIGIKSFEGCINLDTVICRPNTPPSLGESAFGIIASTAVLLVPYKYIDAYKAIAGYANSFAEIKGFSDIEDITTSTATLKWLPDTAVTQYDINVYTNGTHFAQYLVDGNGQIKSSQRFAPSIYHQKLDTTTSSTEVFVISLNGLSAGTDYNYTIDGTNSQSAPIYHEAGSFTTLDEGEEGLFDIISDDPRKQARKILYNGQIYILRGEKVYTVTGEEVR